MRSPKAQQRAQALRNRATDAERFLWDRLRRRQLRGYRFRRQVPIGNYIADFVCIEARLIIEVDGSQHETRRTYDEQRTRYLEQRGFRILRIWDNQVFTEMQPALEAILNMLEATTHQRTAPADARVS